MLWLTRNIYLRPNVGFTFVVRLQSMSISSKIFTYETDDADSMISFISSSFHKSIVQQLYFSLRNPEIAPIKSVVYSNIAKQYDRGGACI